jgi:hypothetical protein
VSQFVLQVRARAFGPHLDLCPCPRYHPTPLGHPCLAPPYEFKPMPLGPARTSVIVRVTSAVLIVTAHQCGRATRQQPDTHYKTFRDCSDFYCCEKAQLFSSQMAGTSCSCSPLMGKQGHCVHSSHRGWKDTYILAANPRWRDSNDFHYCPAQCARPANGRHDE